jgi:hypothetical protein
MEPILLSVGDDAGLSSRPPTEKQGVWLASRLIQPGVGARHAGLHPLEVRQAVGVVPALHAAAGSAAQRP